MWSQGCQAPANTSSHGDKTYKGLWGFGSCEYAPISENPSLLPLATPSPIPLSPSTLRAATLPVWG